MRKTEASPRRHGVSLGAHPCFPDLQGFGRRRIDMAPAEVEAMVVYEIGALQGIAAAGEHRVCVHGDDAKAVAAAQALHAALQVAGWVASPLPALAGVA